MAISNHERVGKALDLLKAGLGPFVDREVKTALESRRLDAFKLRDYAEDPVLANKPTSAWDVAGLLKLMWETWNDVFRRILGPGGTQPRQRAAEPPQQMGPPGDLLQRRRLSGTGLGRPTPRRGLGAAVRRARAPQDGAAAGALRRAGARGAAQAGGRRHRKRRRGRSQAVAGDRHAPQGRRERAIPAGRVRGRPLAGAPGRRDGRVPGPGRVLSANLPDGEPEGPAGRGNPPPRRSGRRPRRSVADQLRGRQDPLHACPISPVLRDRTGGAFRNRRRAPGSAGHGARDGPPRGAGRQQDLAGEPGDEGRRHGRSNPLGRAGVAARRQRRRSPASQPTTRTRRIRAMRYASCSTSTAPA